MADEGCVHAPRARGSSLCMLKGRAGHRSEKAVIYGRFSYKRLVTELLFLVSSERPPPPPPPPQPYTHLEQGFMRELRTSRHSFKHSCLSQSLRGLMPRRILTAGMRGRRVVTGHERTSGCYGMNGSGRV